MIVINRLLAILLLICGTVISHAQNSNDAGELSDVILIKNVHIVKSPTAPVTFGSVLIDNGLIKAVGTVSSVPYNARIIEGDSMYLYAGFIDGGSHTSIPKPEKKDRKDIDNPGNPNYEDVGIMPQHESILDRKSSDSSIGAMAKSGVLTSHIFSHGRLMPGQGSVVSNHSISNEEVLIARSTSFVTNLNTSWGAYPSTRIGAISRWKELYKQAKNAQAYEQKYKVSKKGMVKPDYDETLAAIYPVIDGDQKVFFEAMDDKTMHQILKIQKELGFKLVLMDVKGAWRMMNKLMSSPAEILISLDIPEAEKEEEDKTDDEKVDSDKQEEKKADKKKDEKSEEHKALEKRKKEAVAKEIAQAATLEKSGKRFGFSFIKGKSKDLHKNLRAMIDAGLSEKAALSALTINAAEILGVSDILGTVENGKLANVFMTDKPYFEEKSKIKYTIVQGHVTKHEEKKKKKSGDAEEGLDISGTWAYTLDIPIPENTGTIKITKIGDNNYTFEVATTQEPDDPEVIEDVSLDGSTADFSFTTDGDGMSMDIDWTLDFTDSTAEGKITVGAFGTFDSSATKKSDPNLK